MAANNQQDPGEYQQTALTHANNAEYWLRNKAALDPALTSAVLAVYYQLRSVTEDPDMADAMRMLAMALDKNSSAREEFRGYGQQ